MFDHFYSVGVSHWNCPLEIRELFSMDKYQSLALLKDIKSNKNASGLIVSTCNRTQVFANTINKHNLIEYFIKHTGKHLKYFDKYGFTLEGEQTIQNLFEVSTGIDSQILGDLQIFSQVKEGFELSKNIGALNSEMDRLLQFVFKANKEIQSNTVISKGAASVAHAAVLKIRENTQHLKNKKIVLFGMGEIGVRTLENLNNQSKANIVIVNRTEKTAHKLAKEHNVKTVPLKHLKHEIKDCDVLLVATSSNEFTINHKMIKGINDKNTKLFIDLSVPRNIDPSISKLAHIELIGIDHLNSHADNTLRIRKKDIPKAKTIINLHKLDFQDWMKLHTLGPLIKNIEQAFDQLKENEIEKYKGQYDQNELEKVKPLINSIVKKISSKNIEYLRKRYRYNKDILNIIREMYKLD